MPTEMSEKVVAQFKKLLLARRLELNRTRGYPGAREGEASVEGEPLENAGGLAPELRRAGPHAQGMLMAMDAALTRIAQGTFGMCVRCGEEIGSRRLVAFPWTQYCLGCQHAEEKRLQTPVAGR